MFFCQKKNSTFATKSSKMKEIVQIKDKSFEHFIDFQDIQNAVKTVATRMNSDLKGKNPLFLAVLNGAFMFMGDLMKEVSVPCEISFIRLASYQGLKSTENVQEIFGLTEDIEGRTVVIVEDIVDSGNTMLMLIKQLEKRNPKEIKIATLLLKPEALKHDVKLDYVALEIPNDFIVGYGLDYDGYGRNMNSIYKIKE